MPPDHLAALMEPLSDLERWLSSSKIPHAIIGGVAATLQGHPRATADIDAVVMIPEEGWERESLLAKHRRVAPKKTRPRRRS